MDMMRIRRVRMRVGLAGRFGPAVLVPMMFVMHVGMRMRHRFVNVVVLVSFGDVQPNAHGHQDSRGCKLDGERLAERGDGRSTADERSCRKISPGPRRPKMSKGKNEQREAYAVSEKS